MVNYKKIKMRQLLQLVHTFYRAYVDRVGDIILTSMSLENQTTVPQSKGE